MRAFGDTIRVVTLGAGADRGSAPYPTPARGMAVDEHSRLCACCGGLVDVTARPRSRFCSRACQQADWYAVVKCKDGTRGPRRCRCGKKYLETHGQQKWCSEACEALHGGRRRAEQRMGPLP